MAGGRAATARCEARRQARGVCVRCAGPPGEGRRTCVACSRRATAITRRRYWIRIAAGLCVRCGKRPPGAGVRKCEQCLQEAYEYDLTRGGKRKERRKWTATKTRA